MKENELLRTLRQHQLAKVRTQIKIFSTQYFQQISTLSIKVLLRKFKPDVKPIFSGYFFWIIYTH